MISNKKGFWLLLALLFATVLGLAIEPKDTQRSEDKYINDTAIIAGNIADVSYNKLGFNVEYSGIIAELNVGEDNQLIDLTIGNIATNYTNHAYLATVYTNVDDNISDVNNINDRIKVDENNDVMKTNEILDNDEIIILLGDKGSTFANELIVYEILLDSDASEIYIEELYRNHISAIKPWKIDICELDNDGILEIFIAANKATHYYPEVENRPFFFNFIDGMLVKKWTGSKVRAPFSNVYFFDITGNKSDEFIVIERVNEIGEPEQYVIAMYYWFGFGFILQAESPMYDAINSISMVIDGDSRLIEAEVIKGDETKVVLLAPSAQKTDNEIYLLKERESE
jgi:hypothetical protein